MTDILLLLTLPQTSDAFTALQPTVVEEFGEDRCKASSPRKTPRLDHDSDSGSASRSNRGDEDHAGRGVPIVLQVIGEPVRLPPEQLHDPLFPLVRRTIGIVLTRDTFEELPATYEKIYSACRSIVCVSNKGEGLYDTLRLELEQCVVRLSVELTRKEEDAMGWLKLLAEICKWFESQVVLLRSLLTYLDQLYVLKNTKLTTVRDLSFALFADKIFRNAQIAGRLRTAVRQWVTWERENRRPHDFRSHIPDLISHLLTHGEYSSVFESFYLEVTRSFYVAESAERAQAFKHTAHEFFQHINTRLDEEMQRSKDMLPVGSYAVVNEAVENALLDGRLEWLAKEALGPYLDTDNLKSIYMLYRSFSRVGGSKVLCAAFKAHVLATVQNIVKDAEHDEDMVQRLHKFKTIADSALSTAFVDEVIPTSQTTLSANATASVATSSTAPTVMQPNQEFTYALADSFRTGFKARRNKPAEMIAKYLDKAMRKGQSGVSDTEFEAHLNAVLNLYRFTDDKDVFRTFYHRALAKRLLLERSASDDFEKALLKKLKENYDPEFGMGDHMFNDLALSREAMREYHSKLDKESPAHKLSVMVLQRSVWPFAARKTDIDLPPSMQAELTKYSVFYKVKHQGHKLDWDHALGTVELKAWFKAGLKELSVSLYQAVVLLLFNESTEWLFTDILEQTRMDPTELRRTLQSLACGKKKVLKKRPVGKDVDDADVFLFNADFTDLRAKVHINSIQVKETPEENKRTQTSIEGDRRHYLDAAIVRIMKARKELSYEQLKTATIDAVKSHFVPDVKNIKQRIDAMVDQDYLKRDDEDKSLYVYVA